MLNETTQFWKNETIKQASLLARRELLLKVERLLDKYHRGCETADYVMAKESKDDLLNLIVNARINTDTPASQMLIELGIYQEGFGDGHKEAREYTKKILRDEVWEYHKLTDNFGMTFEQSKKVNELLLKAHNEVLERTIELL